MNAGVIGLVILTALVGLLVRPLISVVAAVIGYLSGSLVAMVFPGVDQGLMLLVRAPIHLADLGCLLMFCWALISTSTSVTKEG